jgi:O-antigen ligase
MTTATLELRRRIEPVVAGLVFGGVCVAAGVGLAASQGSFALLVVLVIALVAVTAFAIGSEYVLLLLAVTAPIGLEQVTAGDRSLLPDLGGWAVSSLRLAVLLAAGLGILALRGIGRKLTGPELAYAGLIVYLGAALVLSPDVLEGVRFLAKVAIVFVAWLAFRSVVRRWGTEFVWKLLLATLAFTIVADLVLLAIGANYDFGSDGASRFGGITGAAAAGALSVGVLALAALYLWLRSGNRLALVLYLLAWIPIFASLTRIAIAAVLAASILLPILMGRTRQAVVITLALLIATLSYAPLRERTAWGDTASSWETIVASIESEGVANLNTGGRENLWEPLWEEWKAHPFFGSGTGASSEILARSTGDTITQAHSDYLALLVNGGIVALALWLLALVGLLVRFCRTGGAASVAAAGLLMYLIAAITDNAIEMYSAVGIPLALLIAVAFEAERRRREPG